jgi:hypothetical protein
MAYPYTQQPPSSGSGANAYSAQSNLHFYQSSYPSDHNANIPPVSGQSTPFAAFGSGGPISSSSSGGGGRGGNGNSYGAGAGAGSYGFGVSGQMGAGQDGLRTGWLAAFGTEGYPGEPPLLEELGVNFWHIRTKVGYFLSCIRF